MEKGRMTQKCVYSHCCLCLDSMSIICSCLCHAASVVSVPAMPLAPAEGGWTPPRAPPPPPPYSITAAAPYSALSLLPSAVLRRSQHGADPLDAARSLSIFPSSLFALFPSLSVLLCYLFFTLRFTFDTRSPPSLRFLSRNIGPISLRERGYSSVEGRNIGDPDWRTSKQRPNNRDGILSLSSAATVIVFLFFFLFLSST